MKQVYSYDDVLLIPKFSDIESRFSVKIGNSLDENIYLDLPVISSPMDTITGGNMLLAMARSGGLGILHRYNTIQEQTSIIKDSFNKYGDMKIAAAIGVTGDYEERALALHNAGIKIICIDVAHGHHSLVKDALFTIREIMGKETHLMAGNVATLEGFDALASWGADSVRVGIGGGSICSTRLVTGHGIPTFQSILDCAKTTHDVKIIADGGIKTILGKGGKKYKVYRGMASMAAQNAWRGSSSTPEGVSTTVPFRGSVNKLLKNIAGGIRSGLSYSGARNLTELRSKASFAMQTAAGQVESSTHILGPQK